MTWLPGQFAKIRNYPKNGCIIKILNGQLHEEIFTEALTLISEKYLQVGRTSFMSDILGLRSIENNTNDMTISLHVYSNN